MKIVQPYEWAPKQFLNPTLNPKIINQGLKKVKNYPVRIEGNKENKSCCTI